MAQETQDFICADAQRRLYLCRAMDAPASAAETRGVETMTDSTSATSGFTAVQYRRRAERERDRAQLEASLGLRERAEISMAYAAEWDQMAVKAEQAETKE